MLPQAWMTRLITWAELSLSSIDTMLIT